MRIPAIAAILFALTGCSGIGDNRSYELSDTKVVPFSTRDHAREFSLFVSLPRNYETRKDKRFPVIFLLDADYSFAITRNVLRHFSDRTQLEEAIIVGIAYPGADADLDIYKRNRVHDYTPINSSSASGYGQDIDRLSGGAPEFSRILAEEILPFVDRRFRTDPTARMIVGHSYGGLFVTWMMLTHTSLFRDYLIVSPSYFYDDKMIFGVARDYIATHKELPARAFFSVGSFEGGGSMATDMKALDDELKAAHLAGYQSTLQVFDGETHNSVFPSAVTRGLRVFYDFKGENKPTVAPGSAPPG